MSHNYSVSAGVSTVITYVFLVLGWTPFALRTASILHDMTKMVEELRQCEVHMVKFRPFFGLFVCFLPCEFHVLP